MSVNHDDRVSSARLAEFWDEAEQQIDDKIDSAVTDSEDTMDEKIAAAKPNYNMPNEDDQIGVGYGYHKIWFNRISPSTNDYLVIAESINSTSGTNQVRYPGRRIIRNNLVYMSELIGINTVALAETCKLRFLEMFAGKLVYVGSIQSATGFDWDEFESDVSNYASTLDYENGILYSPIYNFNGHTYQSRIKVSHPSDGRSFLPGVKIDNGEFVDVTSISSGNTYAFIVSNDDSIATVGCADVANSGITADKLARNAVTEVKIADEAVTSNKIKNQNVSTIKLGTNVKPHFIQNSGNSNLLELNLTNQQIYRNVMGSVGTSSIAVYGLKIAGNTKDFFSKFYYDATWNTNIVVETGTNYFDVWSGFFTGTGISDFTLPVNQEVGDKTTPNASSKFRGVIILEGNNAITKYDIWAEKVDNKLRVYPYDVSFFNHTSDDSSFELFFPLQGAPTKY